MKIFRPVLLLFSVWLLLLTSCNPAALKGYVREPQTGYLFMHVFNASFEKGLYTVHLTMRDHSLTGIAIIKQMQQSRSFRMVCMAETGLKYFDIEFFHGDSIVIHYMMDALNRKKIVSLITSDLGYIFKTSLNENIKVYREPKNPVEGYAIRQKSKGRIYFYYKGKNQSPVRIVHRSFLSSSFEALIKYDENNLPAEIILSHGNSNTQMKLKSISQQ